MSLIAFVLSLLLFHFLDHVSSLFKCHSTAMIWTYYPCSFIISSAPSFSCQQSSINVSIDRCINREMMFFWHFPSGNMTITLQSDEHQSFRLQLFEQSITKRQLMKNVYHVPNNPIMVDELLNIDGNETVTIVSNDEHKCSMKFETFDDLIFDYGTFIRMTILDDQIESD